MKGESYNTSNIKKIQYKINKLESKLVNIRKDFIYKLVDYLTAKTKPKMITIENLDVSEMIKHTGTKDATLHKYIMESAFYKFKSIIFTFSSFNYKFFTVFYYFKFR